MTTKLFSLSCHDQPGLLSRILQHFTRPGYAIHTVSQSRTDVSDITLITLEAVIPAAVVDNMIHKLNRIIGVLDVTVSFGSVLRSALFRVKSNQADMQVWQTLHRHQARVLLMQEDGHLLIQQTAQSQDVLKLFNELDGPALVGFSEQPIPISQPLNWDEVRDYEMMTVTIKSSSGIHSL